MAELTRICIEDFCAENTYPDLSNYYNKSEVDALVNTIEVGEFIIVQSLPSTGNPRNIYLVPKQGGGYTEHIYIDGQWELLGDTDIDLSNYYNKTEADNLFQPKLPNYFLFNSESDISIPNNIDVPNKALLTIPYDAMVIGKAYANWSANANGFRTVFIDTSVATNVAVTRYAASSNGGILQQTFVIYRLQAGETMSVRLNQNSGASMTANVSLQLYAVPVDDWQ